MSRKNRYMDTSKGYSRAAHKAVTMAVVEQDYYEELLDSQDSHPAPGRVPTEERGQAAAETPPATRIERTSRPVQRAAQRPREEQPSRGERPETECSAEDRPAKKSGILGRLFGAMRGLG